MEAVKGVTMNRTRTAYIKMHLGNQASGRIEQEVMNNTNTEILTAELRLDSERLIVEIDQTGNATRAGVVGIHLTQVHQWVKNGEVTQEAVAEQINDFIASAVCIAIRTIGLLTRNNILSKSKRKPKPYTQKPTTTFGSKVNEAACSNCPTFTF